ncbi:hypothetical protein TNCV_3172551 [Trichonephila clavipes]|nr:hypothetical protein TNCV_3172551 [Trichonephila clavipes]
MVQTQDLSKQCDIFYASKGKSYDEPERAKWNDSEKRSFNGSWEGTELVDGTVAARVDVLGKVIPRRAIEDKLSKLVKTSISVDGKLVHAFIGFWIKDRSSSTPVARPELPFEVGNMDLIGPIDPPSLKDINIFYVWLISTLGGACKEQLPAPGNRSNERRDRENDLATTEEEKARNERGEGGEEKARVVKSRHGWTMYLNLVTSQYILDFKKCPIEGME